MPIQTVGDQAQHFQSLRQTGKIKSDLNRLSQELSSQQKSDLTKSLGGDTRQLASLDREINQIQSYQLAADEVGQKLAFAQAQLGIIDQTRGQLMDIALPINADAGEEAILDAARAGEEAFTSFVNKFNSSFGDQALFGGAAVDQNPLAPAADMIASLRTATTGLTDTADILTAIDTWFNDPAGGFATFGYQGDQGDIVSQRIASDKEVFLSVRADGDATIALLKGAATAMIATADNVIISKRTRSELVNAAGTAMLSASNQTAKMQAEVGRAEATILETQVAHRTQLAAFQINRNDLTTADPFETATLLQDVQQQLEMHYTVTARLSRLSLVNYLS